MPRYRYKARDLSGKSVEATIDAADDASLERELREKGLHLISANEVQRRVRVAIGSPALNERDLVLFTMEIGTSYRAGLPLLGTLDDMALASESKPVRAVAQGLADRVRSGQSFADAMAAYPRAFPPLYVELVASAEKTGQLDRIMEDLVKFLEWQKELRGYVASATVYPATILGAVILLMIVLTFFVFPKFLQSFASMGDQLPLPTRVLMNIDIFTRQYWPVALTVVVVVPLVYLAVRNRPLVRQRIDAFKLQIPLIGPLLVKIGMSRLAHNLAIMLGSGLEFSQALRSCERMMGNVVLTGIVADARVAIEQGESFSDAMSRGTSVPSLVRRMLKLGETTGKMEETLEHVSRYYDQEVPVAIKRMFSILQPVILILLAGLVMFMAGAVFAPIYQMLDRMGAQ